MTIGDTGEPSDIDPATTATPVALRARPVPAEASLSVVIDRDGLARLLQALGRDGRDVLGPTVRDGAIVIDALDGIADLPAGWGDEQAPGSYRLVRRDDDALFGHVVGPHSWKAELFPPRTLLARSARTDDGFTVEAPDNRRPAAFVGVRPCDLRAIETQDLVFETSAHPDPTYQARRADTVVVAVQCTDPAATCFCTSMGTGPRTPSGFDLALTEILDGGHRFVVEVGSELGRAALADVPHTEATVADTDAALARSDAAAARIERRVDTDGLPARLAANLEHPQWEAVAQRCLTCANCTMVCPTCFCSAVEDTTDLTGDHAERWRRWDSCFTLDHSYVHGGSVRSSTESRYRQWLTHKFGTWHDQFGVSGCTGCGRCIAWCPVGIDVTVELAALLVDQTADDRGLDHGHGHDNGHGHARQRPQGGAVMVSTRTIRDLVGEHRLLAGLPAPDLDLIAGCGHNVHLPAGRVLFREGEQADTFYLVREGRVAIEVPTSSGQALIVSTAGPGGLVGWSWLFPPYRWHLDARAVEEVSAVAIDGACLRGKCETDTGLGYRLMQCFAQLAIDHLQGARRQLLDLYGGPTR